MNHPRRLFRDRPLPPRPPEIDKLRDARRVIDHAQVFRLQLPDGSLHEFTGAQLIETAEASVAFDDAIRSGDDAEICKALERIERDMER